MAYCFSVGKVLSWGASIGVYDVFFTAWIIRTSRGKRLQGMSRYVQWWENRAKIKYGSPVWPQLTVYLIRAPACSAHMIWMTCGRGEDSMSCTVIGLLNSPNFGKLRQTSASDSLPGRNVRGRIITLDGGPRPSSWNMSAHTSSENCGLTPCNLCVVEESFSIPLSRADLCLNSDLLFWAQNYSLNA